MVKQVTLEAFLQDKILPDLERGRPEQDRPHTLAVVQKLKDILAHEPGLRLDRHVLVIAAYAHDWGYADLFSGGTPVQLDAMQQAKKLHMQLGAERLKALLDDSFFDFLSSAQKTRAVYLVSVHDNPDMWVETDVQVLMEADTLASLDVTLVKPTFDYVSNKKWMENTV